MGWTSFGIYGGDNTQSQHYEFIKNACIFKDDDQIFDCFKQNRTVVPRDKRHLLIVNYNKIVKKIKSNIKDEYDALSWQMLAALFLDNQVRLPVSLKKKAIEATNYLIENSCDEFISPSRRRENLRKFLRKVCSSQISYSKFSKVKGI
jgi:hypothetical protein